MAEAARAAITTILFTGLVGSTEIMQRVGDENAQRLFRAHHQLLQEVVAAMAGTGLQWMGDGLMVAFTSAADAERCAIAMQQAAQRAIGGQRLSIRVGLNSGGGPPPRHRERLLRDARRLGEAALRRGSQG